MGLHADELISVSFTSYIINFIQILVILQPFLSDLLFPPIA
jgi:hypothetical protein